MQYPRDLRRTTVTDGVHRGTTGPGGLREKFDDRDTNLRPLRQLPVDKMTDAQRESYRHLVEGPRGRLPGPYKVWVHNPKLCAPRRLWVSTSPGVVIADRARTGDRRRGITSAWNSDYTNAAHQKRGEEVGLPAAAVEAIIAGLPASFPDRRNNLSTRSRCRWRTTASSRADSTMARSRDWATNGSPTDRVDGLLHSGVVDHEFLRGAAGTSGMTR